MSDDLVKSMEDDLRIGCSASIGDTQKAVAALKNQAAEITRLRAELATAQVEAFKKSAEIARQFAQSEGWSGTSALRLRNCIIAESAIYTKTGGK